MELRGYDAWKTTEPVEFEPETQDERDYELDAATEDWNAIVASLGSMSPPRDFHQISLRGLHHGKSNDDGSGAFGIRTGTAA